MPIVTLTDISVRNLKPVTGKRVTYLDKSVSGFCVRITENGIKTFVLTYGEDRKRVKLGDVGINRHRKDPQTRQSRPKAALRRLLSTRYGQH